MEPEPKSNPRIFGLVVGTVAATAAVLLSRGEWRRAAPAFGLIATILIPCALLHPPLLRGPERVWIAAGLGLGWLSSRIALSLVFFLVLTPLGLLMRLAGRDILGRRRSAGVSSYLQVRRTRRFAPESFERLY